MIGPRAPATSRRWKRVMEGAGTASLSPDRLGQDRSRLGRALESLNVAEARQLFEVTWGCNAQARIAVPPDRLF